MQNRIGLLEIKKKLVFLVSLFLFSIGIEWEMYSFTNYENLTTFYVELFIGTIVLLIYILPLIYLTIHFSEKWNSSNYLVIVALLSGMFIPGWISALGNDYGDKFLKLVLGDNRFIEQWSASITAPLIEEGIKGAIVVTICHLLMIQKKRAYFLVGVSVGLGFQIFEDLSYIIESINTDDSAIQQAFIRLSVSFASHWLLTGIFSVGLYLKINKNEFNARWLLIPIFLHFLWNSPIDEPQIFETVFNAFITTWSIYELYRVLLFLNKRD